MVAFFSGFALSLSFILAIGAQNAFVLQQGLRHSHVFAVCFICALSDAILIATGVVGFNTMIERWPGLIPTIMVLGIVFLLAYGVRSFYAAWRAGQTLEAAQDTSPPSLTGIIATTLALTWLNPHVYLDTLALIGANSTRFEGEKLWFGSGAILASFVFFFSLGYGARLLSPIMASARAWQILYVLIGVVMWAIAVSLFFDLTG